MPLLILNKRLSIPSFLPRAPLSPYRHRSLQTKENRVLATQEKRCLSEARAGNRRTAKSFSRGLPDIGYPRPCWLGAMTWHLRARSKCRCCEYVRLPACRMVQSSRRALTELHRPACTLASHTSMRDRGAGATCSETGKWHHCKPSKAQECAISRKWPHPCTLQGRWAANARVEAARRPNRGDNGPKGKDF